jgi:methionine synthase I (cobalamin-dependent)
MPDRGLDQLPDQLLLDGGMGTSLIARGLDVGREPTEGWNVTRLDEVEQVHRAFVEAGAGAIQTNTFGANRVRLHAFGLAGNVTEYNVAGVRAAHAAATGTTLIIGDLGPTGAIPPPEGDASLVELEYTFAEQASALAAAGVDFLHIETLYHPKEARAAVRGCRAGAPDLAVVVSMTCTRVGDTYRTTMGFSAETMLAAIVEEGADGIGANCSLVPADMLDLVRLLVDKSGLPVFAKPTVAPNGAGPLYPGEFATGVAALFSLGARAVGGCCGTGAADIAAAATVLESADGHPRPRSVVATRRYGSPAS